MQNGLGDEALGRVRCQFAFFIRDGRQNVGLLGLMKSEKKRLGQRPCLSVQR